VGENRLLTGIQEVVVVKLGNFLDIVHFFAYCNHILLVLEYGYETGQAATPTEFLIHWIICDVFSLNQDVAGLGCFLIWDKKFYNILI